MARALLFDLDDTLVVEDRAATSAFTATANLAAARSDVEPGPLALAAREYAREMWRATPVHPYCLRVGISSSEGLWCRLEGDGPQTTWLREWSTTYRRETWRLALVTNGSSCLQREKLAASGLGDRFAAVTVSAEVGVGKPDAAIFRHALAQIGADASHAVMVGDSLPRDVEGAIAAGLGAVWLDRGGTSAAYIPAIMTLRDLPAALAGAA